MLSKSRLNELLVHEKGYIRKAVVDYLKYDRNRDPGVMALILESFSMYPDSYEEEDIIIAAKFFLKSDEDVKKIFACISKNNKTSTLSKSLIYFLDVEQIVKFEQHFDLFTPNQLNIITTKLDYRKIETQPLLEKLYDYSMQADNSFSAEAYNDKGESVNFAIMIDVLRMRKDINIEYLLAELEKHSSIESIYTENLSQLLGWLGCEESTELQMKLMRSEVEFYPMTAIEALSNIGTDHVIDVIEACFLKEEWFIQRHLITVLSNIKTERAEKAILALLEHVTNLDIRTSLLSALCLNFSVQHIDLVEAALEEGPNNETMHSLESNLCLNLLLNDLDHDMRDTWEDNMIRRIEKSRNDMMCGFEFNDFFEKQVPVKVDKKIGRNEPCPCGSGKKYKKCCLNK